MTAAITTVATATLAPVSTDDLILAAESALYEAKNDGGNTVRLRPAHPDLPMDSP